MAGGTLNYRIELDAADAEAALNALQTAGNELFRTLERAAASLTAGGGFRAFATTITAAAGAVVGITTALFAMAKASAETVDELGELAAQTGSTVEEISLLRSALVQLEANGPTLQRAFQRMGNTIQEMWPAIQKSVREASTSMQKDMLSVESATLNLAEAEQRLEERRTGVKTPDWLKDELALKKDLLAAEQARATLAAAIAKAEETAANDVQRLAQYVDALAKGADTSGIKINATVDNLIKGLVQSVGPGVKTLEGVSGGIGEISARAPALTPIILKLADVFANLKDETLKMAIATKLFGRKDAQDLVEALSEGSAEIQKRIESMRALGAGITDTDNTAKKFLAALNKLQDILGVIGTQLGQLFQPAFTAAMELMAANMGRLRGRILEWGTAIRDTLVPILETFTRVLLGIPEAGKDDWLVRYIANIRAFGETVSAVVTNVVIPAFTALLAVVGTLAKGINAVLGTELNAFDLLIGAWVLKILGAFRLLGAISFAGLVSALGVVLRIIGSLGTAIMALPALIPIITGAFNVLATAAVFAVRSILVALGPIGIAIAAIGIAVGLAITYWPQLQTAATTALNSISTTFTASQVELAAFGTAIAALSLLFAPLATAAITAIRSILVALGPIGIAIAVIGTAIALVITYWPQLQAAAATALQWINAKLVESKAALDAWVLTPVANAWEWIKTAFNNVVAYVMQKAQELADWLKEKLTGSAEGGGGSVTGESTGGGRAHGGLIGGRGTGTSDSNLAWVSRGEHIMPARAVAQPGVLAFLEALRRSGGDLQRAMRSFRGFALGGMVRGPIPAFAGGGMVGGGLHPVTIEIAGGPTISGLRASPSVVDELRRAAALAQVRSGGRKPSRYS